MLSILTLNLRFGLAADGHNNWIYRKKAYPLLFEIYQPDFIAFQEANDFQSDFLKEILPGYKMIGKRSPAPLFWQNNLIFYKSGWECTLSDHFFLSPTPSVPSRSRASVWPRQCTLGIFKNAGHQVICVSTHFDFDARVQTESAVIIMDRLSQLPSDIPALIAGDFNSTPYSPCHKVFTGENQVLPPRSLYFKNAFKKPFPGTFHGFTGKAGDPIDWILYRGGLIPEIAEVIQNMPDGIYPSDHFPVHAAFRWGEKFL